jgi:hypothetical protein
MTFITKKHIPRRTFIRGIGATLSLPLLEAMLPAATPRPQTEAEPKSRYVFLHVPHGAIRADWTPPTAGKDFEFSRILVPVERFRDQMIVVSDTDHAMAGSLTPEEAAGDHSRTAAVFLSGAHPKQTQGQDIYSGITIDQILAQHIGQDNPLPSLELCIEDPGSLGVCGLGYSCVYSNTISWSSPTTPLPMEPNPQVVFERLFGDGSTPEARLERRQEDRSILDSLTRDVERLRSGLGASDQARMDAYLTDIREIERRIAIAERQSSIDAERPDAASLPFDAHVKLMFDLQILAFQADVTRISTMMLARDLSPTVYANSGVSDAYHALSHHQDDAERMNRYARLNAYHVSIVGELLEKMQSTPDGQGSLLDHSLVLFGSPISNSNEHDHVSLPVFLAGGGAGRYTGNKHIRNPEHTPMNNIFLTMLQREGIDMEEFGDSTGAMDL